eukprot:1195476-Prorocentrum_minimum.AAC.1
MCLTSFLLSCAAGVLAGGVSGTWVVAVGAAKLLSTMTSAVLLGMLSQVQRLMNSSTKQELLRDHKAGYQQDAPAYRDPSARVEAMVPGPPGDETVYRDETEEFDDGAGAGGAEEIPYEEDDFET